MVSSLDLPRPGRSALPYAALAAAALALDAAPELPWAAGVVAAGLFGAAGTARAVQAGRELAAVRGRADRLIVGSPATRDAGELLRWRARELTGRAARDELRRDLERTLRALDPGRLPSASPLRRPAARACRDDLAALSRRLGDARPVAARGVLLTRSLLRDPAGPLYGDESPSALPHAVRRCLGALEP